MSTIAPDQIRPIETSYQGYRFRSRLEARWAAFFDALTLDWEYEPEGFNFGGERYLPDFWLPRSAAWVEVKPNGVKPDTKLQRFAKAIWANARQIRDAHEASSSEGDGDWSPEFSYFYPAEVLLLAGSPGPESYTLWTLYDTGGIHAGHWVVCPLCHRVIYETAKRSPPEYDRDVYCNWCDILDRLGAGVENATGRFHKGQVQEKEPGWIEQRLNAAYSHARGLRFDSGETYPLA